MSGRLRQAKIAHQRVDIRHRGQVASSRAHGTFCMSSRDPEHQATDVAASGTLGRLRQALCQIANQSARHISTCLRVEWSIAYQVASCRSQPLPTSVGLGGLGS
eukprot:2390896-Alexandrium_andersonii.AAC.1